MRSQMATDAVLTTLNRPTDGLMLSVDRILEQAGMVADSIELIVHGTTLATNALIERRGAKTALIHQSVC